MLLFNNQEKINNSQKSFIFNIFIIIFLVSYKLRRIVTQNKVILLFAAALFIFNSASGKEMGYFDIQNGTGYLGFSRMSQEFKITSLMNSAIANDAKATQIFIASGADVNQKNIAGVTALHLAARNNSYESAKVLIDNGAKINERDAEGWTPLMRASLAGNKKMMQLLIENGANLWTQNSDGETALLHTAMADCYECGKLIIDESNTNSPLFRIQSRKALQIVNKRYNEPFIKALTENYNGNQEFKIINTSRIKSGNLNEAKEDDNITHLVYIFTGKTISNEELGKISKNTYDISQKTQFKLEKSESNSSNRMAIPEPSNIEPTTTRKLFLINNEQPEFRQKLYNTTDNNSGTKYKLGQTTAKPVIDDADMVGPRLPLSMRESVPNTEEKNTAKDLSQNKKLSANNVKNYNLGATTAKPVMDKADLVEPTKKAVPVVSAKKADVATPTKKTSPRRNLVLDSKDGNNLSQEKSKFKLKSDNVASDNSNNRADGGRNYKLSATTAKPVIDRADMIKPVKKPPIEKNFVLDSKNQDAENEELPREKPRFKLKTNNKTEETKSYKLGPSTAKPVIDEADLKDSKKSNRVYKISKN